MSAQLLYKMIKSKTEYPLHKAIKVEREDVVFLYLIEMDSQVSARSKPAVSLEHHRIYVDKRAYVNKKICFSAPC